MCELCYSFIYDFILSPVPINHLVSGHIDGKSLKRCLHEVTDCISRALRGYVKDIILIDCFRLFRETYEANAEIIDLIEPEVPREYKEQRYDEWMWNKFKETNQEEYKELHHAIQVCMDNMVVKRVMCKELMLEQFFMHKLRNLLVILPDIHKEHSEKRVFEHVNSLGSVPQNRIDYIRRMAGLPVKEEVYISIYSINEFYN
jgi:hypothetical protein